MAKTESTAVNDLIHVAGTQAMPTDQNDDLMFRRPTPVPAKKTRMTSTLQGVPDVPPLPRGRAPSGTQTNLPPAPPAVRMTSAPAPRSTTIPPLPSFRPSTPSAAKLDAPAQPPALPINLRVTKPSLPPPTRPSSIAEGTPGPELFSRSGATLPPPTPSASRTSPPPSPSPRVSMEPHRHSAALPAEGKPRPSTPTAPPLSRATMIVAAVPAPVRAPTPPVLPVVPVAVARDVHPFAAPAPIDMTSHEPWFEPSNGVELVEGNDTHWSGTLQVPKHIETRSLIAKLIVPMIGLVVAGVFVGGFVAFNGEGGKHAAAAGVAVVPKPDVAAALPAVAAMPAPAAVAVPVAAVPTPVDPPVPAVVPAPVAPAPTPAPVARVETAPAAAVDMTATPVQPNLVDVRIDSKPSGATVMLVDRGHTSFLGTTPMTASMDPARAYDVVFTYTNRPTQVEHFDPRTSKHLAITLGKPGNAAAVETHARAPIASAAVTAPAHKVAAKTVAVAQPAAAVTGSGTLMVSSKPPCEIYVDGKPTGLSTPQRAMQLPAGSHKITLVNTAQNLRRTMAVQISADKPTKLIQDLMK